MNADGTSVDYYIVDGLTVAERWNNANGSEYFTMRYVFDQNGSVIGFCTHYPGFPEGYFEHYLFAKNLQGDVVAMYMVGSGLTLIATYEYDSWGRVLSVKDANGSEITNPSHLAMRQPFRYRGYHYDMETGFYYLQSRYYDPAICRFINADTYTSTGQGFLGHNMFAYCGNNPIMGYDPTGTWDWGIVGKIALTTVVVATCLTGVGLLAAIATTATTATITTAVVAAGVATTCAAIDGGICAQRSGGNFWNGFMAGAMGGAVGALFSSFRGGDDFKFRMSVGGRAAGSLIYDLVYEWFETGSIQSQNLLGYALDIGMDSLLSTITYYYSEDIANDVWRAVVNGAADGAVDVGQTYIMPTPSTGNSGKRGGGGRSGCNHYVMALY